MQDFRAAYKFARVYEHLCWMATGVTFGQCRKEQQGDDGHAVPKKQILALANQFRVSPPRQFAMLAQEALHPLIAGHRPNGENVVSRGDDFTHELVGRLIAQHSFLVQQAVDCVVADCVAGEIHKHLILIFGSQILQIHQFGKVFAWIYNGRFRVADYLDLRMSRSVDRVIKGMPVQDGAGVQLTRILGTPVLDHLDPFLMLDEFRSDDSNDYIAGFPPHPHRGFETVTYMKQGRFRHKDSRGNEGLLVDGSVQWMTAGRGIIHSEMPEMTNGLLWGYQLWLNLPAKHKMTEPRYQDIGPEKIPCVEGERQRVRLIAGEYGGQSGPAETLIPVNYFDVELQPGGVFEHTVPASWNCFAFVYEGSLRAGPAGHDRAVQSGELVAFGDGEMIRLHNEEQDEAGFLLLAAERIEEPIARHGPFVMNTEAELIQAFVDFQNGTLHR